MMNMIVKDETSFGENEVPLKAAVTETATDARTGVVVEKSGRKGPVEVALALTIEIIEEEQVLAEDTLLSEEKVLLASASDQTGL